MLSERVSEMQIQSHSDNLLGWIQCCPFFLRHDAAKCRKPEEMTAAVLCCTSSLKLPEIGDRLQKQETHASLCSCSDTNTHYFSFWIFYEKGNSHLLTVSNVLYSQRRQECTSRRHWHLYYLTSVMEGLLNGPTGHTQGPQRSRSLYDVTVDSWNLKVEHSTWGYHMMDDINTTRSVYLAYSTLYMLCNTGSLTPLQEISCGNHD